MTEFEIYRDHVKPGDVVYDIGAHVGELTENFADKARLVYAFEPSPLNFPKLAKKMKSRPNVKCFNLALHDRGYSIKTRFKDCSNGQADALQHIHYVRIEEFVAWYNAELPNFVKMDIEGMEAIVLKTFDRLIFKESRPILYVEIHAKPRASQVQVYEHNPHFLHVDEGGFDFNKLKDYDYDFYTVVDGRQEKVTGDYNPSEGFHGGSLMIPR